MATQFSLPYNAEGVVDPRTYRLIELALIEDWRGQQLFNKLVRGKKFKSAEDTASMRRFLHVQQILEAEIRMRYKDRGYYGI